jgi:hypothetical protein
MDDYDFEKLLFKNHIHAGIVFPRVAWEQAGGYPEIMDDGREDWAFNIALGIHGWCGVHVKEFGYLYRREGQNRSEINTTQRHREVFLGKLKSLFPEIYGGDRPMACCGKGGARGRATVSGTLSAVARSTKQSLTSHSLTGGTTLMAAPTGSTGPMIKIEYLGKQQSTIWDGPVTRTRYRFGVDRKSGWVDRRDAGEHAKSGFLKLKDRHNNFLFKVVSGNGEEAVGVEAVPSSQGDPVVSVTGAEDAVSATVVEDGQEALVVVADPTTQEDAVSATVVEENLQENFRYNPSEMYPSDIKRLNLTKTEWETLYRLEMAGKNRPAVKTFIEEKLASD